MNLRFHWMLPKGGELAMTSAREAARYRIESTSGSSAARLPDLKGWLRFAGRAAEAGIDSVLISFSRHEPDPLLTACALGRETETLGFIVAFRAGLVQPAAFVQQVNTLSHLIGGRVSLNTVAGSSREEQRGYGDFLAHDERYARAEEFLEVCRSFWRTDRGFDHEGRYFRVEGGRLHTPFAAPGRTAPEVYVGGHSEQAERLAIAHGSCWLRVVDTPEKLQPVVARARHRVEVCLRLCLICRPTRDEALAALRTLLPDDDPGARDRMAAAKDDSRMYQEAASVSDESAWIGRNLWAGFAPRYGPVWTTLVGSPGEVARAFLEYKRIGVTQFILSGWPELDEVEIFGRDVLPLVRDEERRQEVDRPRTSPAPQGPEARR